jgi:hypothetical protein
LAKKKGERYKCEDCGLVLLVEEPCGCETNELICCEKPMKAVKEVKAAKPKTVAKVKEKPKPKK